MSGEFDLINGIFLVPSQTTVDLAQVKESGGNFMIL
jgi:hypothetical protein